MSAVDVVDVSRRSGLILPLKDGESKEYANIYMCIEGFSSIVSTRATIRRKLVLAHTAHPSRCVSEREYKRASERIMCGAERRAACRRGGGGARRRSRGAARRGGGAAYIDRNRERSPPPSRILRSEERARDDYSNSDILDVPDCFPIVFLSVLLICQS